MTLSQPSSLTVQASAGLSPFAAPSVYNICVRGRDSGSNTGADACILVPVYDPNGGFVTGGGQVWSPAGADLLNISAAGIATFGFVSKYQQGRSVPSGNLEFQFKEGNLNFKSTSMDWLVVTGQPRAVFRGTGTINGGNECKFEVDAWDHSLQPGNVDGFGLKIFSCTGGGDRYSLAPTPLTKGSVIIHNDGNIIVSPLTITTTSLPAGEVGVAYSQNLAATGGTLPYSWSILSGTLPSGLTLSGSTISGTPNVAGTANFTIRATDSTGPTPRTSEVSLSITVASTVIPINSCPYTINSPGSYRLFVDCVIPPGNDGVGIGIAASNVNLDLNAHTISGPVATASDCAYADYGIYVGPSVSFAHISNGTLRNVYFGILLNNVSGHDNQVNSVVSTSNCFGIDMRDTHNNDISNNNFSGNFKVGISVQRTNDSTFNSNTVNNNGVCCGDGAFFLQTSDHNTITGNTMSNNQNGLRLSSSSRSNTIAGNNSLGNFVAGIWIDGQGDNSGNVIQGNTALSNGGDLADFNPACVNTWTNNTFVTDSEGDGPGAGCIR
jgi:parallel beta-helix repeat protein